MPKEDWEPLGEDVANHTTMYLHAHEDGRSCMYHARLAAWATGEWPVIDRKCLRSHPDPYGRK